MGIHSCAHWLAWQCGLAQVTAREHVRVARALRGLPTIAAAFDNGRLSFAQVRALTRIAAPDCEAAPLEFASSATASQTERFCRAWRRVDDDTGSGADPRPEVGQSFQTWTDDAGFLTLKIRMPAEAGAVLLTHLSRVLFPAGEPPLADPRPEPRDRLDLFAIAVLMGNRDLTRRLAAEAGLPTTR